MILSERGKLYMFGEFRVDLDARLLFCQDQPVHLTEKAFDVLLTLLQERGKIVTKSHFLRTIWRDSFVEEGNVPVAISMVRKAIGDRGDGHRYIKTVSKHGYRFDGDVFELEKGTCESPISVETPSPMLPKVSAGRRLSVLSLTRSILLLILICILAGGLEDAHWATAKGISPRIPSISVVPFQEFASDGVEDDHIGMELANGIITRIASTGKATVRPINDMVNDADLHTIPPKVDREPKVDAILTGYIEVPGDIIRVTLQLVRVSDGSLLWADSYELPSPQLPVLEDAVARRVDQSLSVLVSQK
jgi:DNA-binding winged helix-turn-helix (wHTH) protein/TolB-like protein